MKVFYHNDLDGRCAGAIVAHFTGQWQSEDYIEVDYVMNLPLDKIEDGERIYFVDYSFKENTLEVLRYLQARKCPIVWIDHHTSSIKLCEAHPDLYCMEGCRNESESGAALTWRWFTGQKFEQIPFCVQLVSDYDCWKFEFGDETKAFKLGVEATDYDALDQVWRTLLNDHSSVSVDKYIGIGALIKSYVDKTNDYYREHFAYETEIAGHKCLVVNQKTNSWVFGSKYNEYPLVMVWVFDGTQYVCSIFSGNPEIDCSKIAESYGGGGHKGAAGFSSKELLFRKV